MYLKPILLICALCLFTIVKAQEDTLDLDKLLDEELAQKKPATELVEATFKSSRIINGHSIENTPAGILDFRIAHRFGTLNNGFYQLFGLDNATMRMGVDYGITNRLTVGFGRSTYQKQYDAFGKFRLLRQSTGEKNMPVSVSLLASVMLATDTTSIKNNYNIPANVRMHFSDKLSYAYQVIIARKFSNAFSLQLMPTMVHSNVVPLATDPNDLFAMGIGGRLKITQRISINAEYYYNIPGRRLEQMAGQQLKNPLSIGFDIETGGHVFQLHFTNSRGMTERQFITETPGSWSNGDIHFGFNISRVFQVGKRRN